MVKDLFSSGFKGSYSNSDTTQKKASEAIDCLVGGTKNESVDSHTAEKIKNWVETPKPDRSVSLNEEPSLLSPDFNQKRAMTEAKFNAYQKGMEQMRGKKG